MAGPISRWPPDSEVRAMLEEAASVGETPDLVRLSAADPATATQKNPRTDRPCSDALPLTTGVYLPGPL